MDSVKVEIKIDVIMNEKDNTAAKMMKINKLIIIRSTTMIFNV